MQTKKRARAVKFGSKAKPSEKTEAELKKIEEEAAEIKKRVQQLEDESKDEEKAEDSPADDVAPEVAADAPPHGVEAHFTSVQTVDIKELPEEDEPEASKAEKVQETPVAEEPQEPAVDEVVPAAESVESAEEREDDVQEEVVESAPATVGQDGEFFNAPPDAYEKKSSFPYFLKVAFITFLIGVVFIAGGYYAANNQRLRALLPIGREPEPTEAPVTPEPTEVPVDLSKYTVRVLNGTGRSGEAATVQDSLNSAGFQVVSVGNAAADDLTETEIAAIEEVEQEFLDKLREELSKTYEVGDVERVSSGAADIVVTIGGEKKQ